MFLVIGVACARALMPEEVVGNGLDDGLESGTATASISEVAFDRSQVEDTRKTNRTKHRRNPFAKMFPEFEQIPTPDEEETGEGKQDLHHEIQ